MDSLAEPFLLPGGGGGGGGAGVLPWALAPLPGGLGGGGGGGAGTLLALKGVLCLEGGGGGGGGGGGTEALAVWDGTTSRVGEDSSAAAVWTGVLAGLLCLAGGAGAGGGVRIMPVGLICPKGVLQSRGKSWSGLEPWDDRRAESCDSSIAADPSTEPELDPEAVPK